MYVGPGSINIDGIVIGNNGGQIVISGASDFVFQSTTGAPSVSSSATANIALNAFNQANLAFNQANTSYGSFAQANLAYDQANSSFGVAVSAFAQANLAFTAANNAVDTWVRNQANAAYDAANSAVTTGQANVGAGLITVTSAYQANVGAGRIADVASGQANVGAGLITTKAAYEANVGVEVAARAANVGASVVTLTNNLGNAFNQANSAYTAANTALNISQNIRIQDYTLQLTDRGGHIYSTNTAVQVITIPNSGVVAWPTGTVIDIVLNGSGMINVATSNDVTLYVANNSTVKGYANVYPRGWATLLNVGANTWFIKGQGVD